MINTLLHHYIYDHDTAVTSSINVILKFAVSAEDIYHSETIRPSSHLSVQISDNCPMEAGK